MILIVFLLFILVLRTQNEEIRTEDFMNFLNPIDSQENRKAQNLDLFIEQYLNFNEENLQESDTHANIRVQQQNNMSSDLFCEILCDSSFMNVESKQSTSLFDPKSDQKLLYDEIESFLDSTSFEMPNPTIGTSLSFIELECQCVGLCLCITNPKLDNTSLDIDSSCYIDSDILSSDISLSNKKNQHKEIKNKDILQCEPCHIECEIKADLNSTEQCLEQKIFQDMTKNMQSPVQSNHITSLSHNRNNNKYPEQIEKLYLDYLNKMDEVLRVQANCEAERNKIQNTVQSSKSQEIVITSGKNQKKRKYSEESNKITKRKTENVDSAVKKPFHAYLPGESDECFNSSENEPLANQAKIIYDPDSQDGKQELEFHLKNCIHYKHKLLKRLIIKINYENSQVKSVKYIRMQSDKNIPKTKKSYHTLHIFGTFKTRPSRGGSTFTVRVPKLVGDQAQFKKSNFPLASAFVPMTIFDGYNLSMTMSKNKKKMKQMSASFQLDSETVYVPDRFYAYHFQQVIRFEINRRANNCAFYHFEYWPEKNEELDFNS
ncbi:hypothetical protein M153_3400030899 [Pseudoloma neurophilia]|uniref:Uncharacterized protein n=1 Tax=Pseudoloma neurophilia TaxID=146866 RepID=A0A0R0M0H7_9MICR|nr:hypothetical protein M153_3400030899 [Pseudoloma neurophilia]